MKLRAIVFLCLCCVFIFSFHEQISLETALICISSFLSAMAIILVIPTNNKTSTDKKDTNQK